MASSCLFISFLSLLLLSAIPIAFIISLERAPQPGHVYRYHSLGWFRESAKWDELNRRFLVSHFEGGVGEIRDNGDDDQVTVDETTVVHRRDNYELAGNASLGICIDRVRNRLLVVEADVFRNRYSGLAAYHLSSSKRLFLVHLSSGETEKTFADDVAVDDEGNAYVTDAKASKIWKVSVDGKLLSTIRSPLFTPKNWYNNLVALNGIVYHPNGYLLVIHTFTGNLYKINLNTDGDYKIQLVNIVKGSLKFGDGLELLSENKLVVAGNPPGRLVESLDGWETAAVVGKFSGSMHRLATAAMVKDGKVYLNYGVGFGYPKKKHAIIEAVFS